MQPCTTPCKWLATEFCQNRERITTGSTSQAYPVSTDAERIHNIGGKYHPHHLSDIADAIYSVYITATEIVDQFEQGTYGVTTTTESSTPRTPVKEILIVEVQITRLFEKHGN